MFPAYAMFCRRFIAVGALGVLLAMPHMSRAAPAAAPAPPQGLRIIAVVNGDVISNDDVENRARLFALSTGLPMSADVLDRLKPQIVRQLIDERLRIQEVNNEKIIVPDKDIATAIRGIEQQNNMPAGALRQKLAADGVSQRTLIDQIRAQLGWTQVLRQRLGDQATVTDKDIEDQQRLRAQETGKQEYRIGEIFIPIDDPANTTDAEGFADTVIKELRAGAPFPIVAAQFSQTQTALEGGELGWVQTNQVDADVARLIESMPVGAVSNPVKVAGGFDIVTLQGKRQIGSDIGTAITVRQAFLAFSSPLNPQAPTEQQRQTLEKAKGISNSVHGCDQMDQVAKTNNGAGRPVDPGELRLETLNPPAFRQLLTTLPIGKPTEPLVSSDGIAVVVVCTREQKNMATLSRQDTQRQIIDERVELLSRQLLRDLRRQSTIDIRGRV